MTEKERIEISAPHILLLLLNKSKKLLYESSGQKRGNTGAIARDPAPLTYGYPSVNFFTLGSKN